MNLSYLKYGTLLRKISDALAAYLALRLKVIRPNSFDIRMSYKTIVPCKHNVLSMSLAIQSVISIVLILVLMNMSAFFFNIKL